MLSSRFLRVPNLIACQSRKSTVFGLPRVIPAYLIREASSHSYTKDKKKSSQTIKPESTQITGRRYVEVDSPFAKANRYTYAMPDDPYVASEKVAKILEIGTVDDAADYIKALPIYLQSPIVWNQIIGYCAKYGRANYAEQYYSQMRKRGIEPNERTFTLMLAAYSKSSSPQSVQYAEAWIKKMKDFNIKPSMIHINNLLRVYNHAEHPEKTIDMLKRMSTSGEMVPDAVTYTIALQACTQLPSYKGAREVRHIWQDILRRIEKKYPNQSPSLLSQKAASIVWKEDTISQQNKANNTELKLDDGLVVTLLSAVTRTAVTEHDVLTAIQAIEKLYSLYPSQAAAFVKKNRGLSQDRQPGFGFQPSVKVLDAILRFSGGLREFKLGKEYFDLALQQFPRLEPDQYVKNTYAWIEKQLKREENFEKKRYNRKPQQTHRKS